MSAQAFYISRPHAEEFLQNIDTALKQPEKSPLLFHVWGEVGVGKSSLLQEIRQTYENQRGSSEGAASLVLPAQPVKKRGGWWGWLHDEPEEVTTRPLPPAAPQNESGGKKAQPVVVVQASFGLIEGVKDPIKLMKQLYDDLAKDDLIKKLIPQSSTPNSAQKDDFLAQYEKYFDTVNKLQTQPIQEKGKVSEEQISLVKKLLAGGVGLAMQLAVPVPGMGGLANEGMKTALDTVVDVAKAGLTERDRIQSLVQQHQTTQNNRKLQELILDPVPNLSLSFATTLKEWSSRYPILLLLDTYEGVTPDVDSWLVQLLKNPVIPPAAVRFVVSSRQSLFRVQGGDWERFKTDHNRLVEELRLEPFELAQTQAYLKPIGVTELNDITAIHQFTKGLPYSLDLVRQKLQDAPKIDQQAISQIIRELRSSRNVADLILQGLNLDPVKKQQVRQVTQFAACCYGFYPKLIQHMMEAQKLDFPPLNGYPTWFEWLKQQSFVEPIEERYRLNSAARAGLQQLLWQEDEGESAAEIHTSLAAYFKKKSDWEVSDSSPVTMKYENPDWVRNRIRFIYHLLFSRQADCQLQFLSHFFEGLYLQTDVVKEVLRAITAEADLKDTLLPYASRKFLTQIRPAVEFSFAVLGSDKINNQTLQKSGLSRLAVDQSVQVCFSQIEQLEGLARFLALLLTANRCTSPEEGRDWLLKARDEANKLVTADDREFNSKLFQEVGYGMVALKQYEEAIADFSEAIRLNPDHANAYYDRGNAREAANDLTGAITDYDAAIRLKPDDAAAYYNNRGIAREAANDLTGAITDYDAAIRLKPDDASAYYNNRGIARGKLKNWEGAIADYDKAIELKPDDAPAYYNRGNVREAANDLAGAIADYDMTISLKPDDASAYYNRGNVREAANDLAGAIADYDMAISLKPDDAYGYWCRGNAREAANDLAGAIADYDMAISLKPDDASAYWCRGNAREAANDLAGAIIDYTQAIELNPEYASAYYNRGIAREAANDLAGAIADYDMAISLKPDDASAYWCRGNARKAANDLAGAITDYDKAIELNPEYASAYYNRGSVRKAANDLEGAITDYDKAIELNPEYASAYYNRGSVRKAANDLEGAIADYTQAIELNPEYALAYNNRGNARGELKNWEGAIADYTQVISLAPNEAAGYYYRGSVHKKLGHLPAAIADFDEAIRLIDETIRLNPNEAAGYYGKASLHSLKEEGQTAIESLQQAINLDSKLREEAKNDSDFDSIREDEKFRALVEE